MLKALSFLRLVDKHDGSLSLTSVVLLASMVGLFTNNVLMLGAFTMSVLLYAHKRKVSETYVATQLLSAEQSATLAQLKGELGALPERLKRVEESVVLLKNRVTR